MCGLVLILRERTMFPIHSQVHKYKCIRNTGNCISCIDTGTTTDFQLLFLVLYFSKEVRDLL
jgi:hypothetical protein